MITTHVLKEDCTSIFRVKYSKKGDPVRLISLHGKVAIVENLKGVRFPVKEALLIQWTNQTSQSKK